MLDINFYGLDDCFKAIITWRGIVSKWYNKLTEWIKSELTVTRHITIK